MADDMSAGVRPRAPSGKARPTLTDWQRERAAAPFVSEFNGPRALACWIVFAIVGVLFWTALFAWTLS